MIDFVLGTREIRHYRFCKTKFVKKVVIVRMYSLFLFSHFSSFFCSPIFEMFEISEMCEFCQRSFPILEKKAAFRFFPPFLKFSCAIFADGHHFRYFKIFPIFLAQTQPVAAPALKKERDTKGGKGKYTTAFRTTLSLTKVTSSGEGLHDSAYSHPQGSGSKRDPSIVRRLLYKLTL